MSNQRIVRGVRQSIPAGYVVGRTQRGKGAPGLVSLQDIGQQLVSSGAVSPGGAPGTTGTTYTAGDGLVLTGTVFSVDVPLDVDDGGTGLTGGTSGGVLAYTGAGTLASSGALAQNALVLGGGAGVVPATDSQWTVASHILIGNANAAAAPAAATGTALQLVGVDAAGAFMQFDTFAASNGHISRRANGTNASKTALSSGDRIGNFQAFGYDGTNYGSSGSADANIQFNAVENFTNVAHGTKIVLRTTPVGSVTNADCLTVQQSGCAIQGTTTSDDAAAGYYGEYTSQVILIANEVSINSAANVASVSLTAGDWDVWGELWVDTNTGTATVSGRTSAGITATSATLAAVPADATGRAQLSNVPLAASVNAFVLSVAPVRASLSAGTTTYYLVGACAVAAGTAYGYGKICARRIR